MTEHIRLPQGATLKRAPEQQPSFRLPPGATIKRAPGMEPLQPAELQPQTVTPQTVTPQLDAAPAMVSRPAMEPAAALETPPDAIAAASTAADEIHVRLADLDRRFQAGEIDGRAASQESMRLKRELNRQESVIPVAPAGPNLPFPDQPEATTAETAEKFVENIPAMFKRSAGGLMQATAKNDIPSAGMPGLMMSLDPRAGRLVSEGIRSVTNKAIEMVTGDTIEGDPAFDLGNDIFTRATADLQANTPNIDPESLKGYGYDIANALVQMSPAIATSIATRNPNTGLGVLGVQVYGDRYGESIAAGRTPDQAHQDATFYALAEAIPERIPMGILMQQGTAFLPRVSGAMVAEGVQEVFTEILQAGYDAGILDEQMTWGEAWERMKRAGIVGAFVGGGMATVAHPFVRGQAEQPAEPPPAETPSATEPAPQPSPRGEIETILNDERTADEMRAADAEAAQQAEAAAREAEAEALARIAEQHGLPETGKPVTVMEPDGNVVSGTLEEVFEIDGTAQARIVTDQGDAVEVFLDDVSVSRGTGEQAAPVTVETPQDVEAAATKADPAPSPAQKEAGNYKKGHMKWQGLDIAIENARGSERTGIGQNGVPWSVTMPAHYGYMKRSEGADGDHVDVYVGESPESDLVVVVDQIEPDTGAFDEHKVMLGFGDSATEFDGGYGPEWLATYVNGFSDGSGISRVGGFTSMTVAEFKEWLAKGDTKKPLAYKKPEPAAPGAAAPVERVEPPAASTPPSPERPGAAVAEAQPDMLGGPTVTTEETSRRETADDLVREAREAGMSDRDILDSLTAIEGGVAQRVAEELPAETYSTLFQDESLIAPMRELIARGQADAERRNRMAQGKPEDQAAAKQPEPQAAAEVVEEPEETVVQVRGRPVRIDPDGSLNAVGPGYFPVSPTGYKSTAGQRGVTPGRLEELAEAQDKLRTTALRDARKAGRMKIADDADGVSMFIQIDMAAKHAIDHAWLAPEAEQADLFKAALAAVQRVSIVPGIDAPQGYNNAWTPESLEERKRRTLKLVEPLKSAIAGDHGPLAHKSVELFGPVGNGAPPGVIRDQFGIRDEKRAARKPPAEPETPPVKAALSETEARAEAVKLLGEKGDRLTGGLTRTDDGRLFKYSADQRIGGKGPHAIPGRIQIADDHGNVFEFRKSELAGEAGSAPPSQIGPESAISTVEEPTDGTTEPVRTDRQGPSEEASAGDVRRAEDERRAGEVPGRPGRTGEPDGGRRAQRDTREQPGAKGLPEKTPASDAGAAERGGDRDERSGVQRPADRKPAERIRGANYRIGGVIPEAIVHGGPKAKAEKNLKAIKILKEIEADGRMATVEEQSRLVQYTGWGGIVQAFPKASGQYTKGWEDFGKQLKELLTPEEYDAARASTPNAHYTSTEVIRAMWSFAEQTGFKHGKVLEPGMGVGYFLGLAPGAAQLHGVELDSITGRIAKMLYPESDIRVEGFQDARFPEGHFDLAIGNVPFADVRPFDPKYNKGKFSLHDYYFIKTLALTKPGGYVMFITSRYTMDKKAQRVRKAIAKQADLVGAVRLPNNAFKGIANTEVTTDIIVLRKRKQGEEPAGPNWAELKPHGPDGIAINEYFADHPNMMAGNMALTGTMYGKNEPTLDPGDTPLPDALREIFTKLHEDARSAGLTFSPQHAESPADRAAEAETIEAPETVKEGAFFVEDGLLYQKQYGRGEPQRVRAGRGTTGITKVDYDRLARLSEIRDAARQVLKTQMEDGPGQTAARLRLNALYDQFVEKHGPINLTKVTEIKRPNGAVIEQRRTPNLRLFKEDPDGMLVAALEDYDIGSGKAAKAAIFTERVLSPEREIKRIDTPEDALLASLNKHNRVDLDYIADLLGGTPSAAIEALSGQIFRDPATGEYVTADAYLSGDVRRKLAEAEKAAEGDEEYRANAETLRQIQPEDLSPSQIEARLGSPWLPKDDIARFTAELLGGNRFDVKISHSAKDAEWIVDAPALKNTVTASSDWGTDAVDAVTLIGHALNLRSPTVTRTVYEDGRRREFKDVDATLAAQDKLQKIKNRFREWIWEDAERGQRLARYYNDNFNTIRLRSYDGAHLTFAGMKEIVPGGWFQGLRPHQKNAVWRVMQSGNTLLAHEVGAGKTMTMVTIGMEMKRVGLISKPMYVVPNHMLDQFSRELLQLYPNAKIMVADEAQFHTNRRKLFVNKVASENWDAVVITHSAFGKVPISPSFEVAFLRETIAEYEALEQEARQEGDRNLTKRIEKQKQRWEARLSELASRQHKDTGISFEETGIDFLFLDEAHEFKNLETRTKIQNVKNINVEGSQKSFDLLMKLRYLDALNPSRSVVFSTATPISNSMVEMYTMQRYLQPRMLMQRGLEHFDAWAGQFGETVTALELDPTGAGYRIDTRFAKFVNVPELLQMYREIADVQTGEMLNLPTPRLKGGKAQIVEAKASPEQVEAVEQLKRRLDTLKGRRAEKGEDNPLKVVTDGRHIALDMRTRYPGAEDFADSKINKAVDRIYETWENTKKKRLTQLVFIDLSSPTGGKGFSVYEDMRSKLIAKGIPEKEVAFIHDYAKAAQKARLFGDVRAGKTRVLFGSTRKMGIGTNVQTRLAALHHMDAPWRPADVQQRDGRIMRQGNQNAEVEIFRYVTSGTFDAYMWQTLETKHRFIQQVMTGDLTVREMEDLDSNSSLLDPATVKAIASGNPMVLEKAGIDAEIAKLSRLEAEHRDQQFRFRRDVAALPERIDGRRSQAKSIARDIERRTDTRGDAFKMAVGGRTYSKRNLAGEALVGTVQSAASQIANSGDVPGRGEGTKTIGKIGGFDVDVVVRGAKNVYLALRGELSYSVEIDLSSPKGMVQRLENALGSLKGKLESAQEKLADDERRLADMKERIDQPFEHADRMAEIQRRSKEIEDELKPKQGQAAVTPAKDGDEKTRYSLFEEGEPFDGPRATGIPADATEVSVFRNTRPMQGHKDYQAAKGGDVEAAVRMVADLVKPESIEAAQKAFGADAVFVPVIAEEASGRNAIPDALSQYFASAVGADTTAGIVQANRAYHTGAKAIERLAARVRFRGPVEKGQRYVLVDDVTVMGSTLADLAEHIQRGGGEVVGVITLVNGSRTRILTPERALIRKIERRFGNATREIFGIDPAGLTAAEAAYVINFRDADSLRARGAAGKRATESRLRAKGLRPPAPEKGKLSRADRATTEPAPEAGFSMAERRQQVEAALRAELDAMGLGDIALKVRERVEAVVDGRLSGTQGRYIRGLIEVSLQARDTRVTLNHEALHALRDLNLFTGAEWAALERKAAGWREKYRIDERYKGEPEWVRVEEAIAHAYGDWAAGDVKTGGAIIRAFNKIKRLLERIGNALRGLGYRAAEDLFEAIKAGEVGSRPRPSAGFEKQAAAFFGKDVDAASLQKAVERDRKAMFSLMEEGDTSVETRPDKGGIVIEERSDAGDLGIIKRYLYTPEKAFKRWPALSGLQDFGVQVEMRMSELITRLMHDYNRVRARLSRDQYEKLADILFVGDAEQTEFTAAQLTGLGADDAVAGAYLDIRSLFEKVGRFVDQHRRAMMPQVRRRKLSVLRRMARIRDMDNSEFRQLYNKRSRLRRKLRLGEGDPAALAREIEEAERRLGSIREQTDEYRELVAELDRLDAVLAQTSVRKRTGYVPHKFFGSWAVYQVETEGDEATHKMVAGDHGFHPDRSSAVKAAKAHLDANPDANLVVRPVQFQFPASEATALTDAAYWRFMQKAGAALELKGDELRDAVRGVARRKFRRRIAGFTQFRKGVQGYSKDFDRVMIAHIAEAVRYVMLDKLKYRAINTLEGMGLSPYRSANLERGTLQEAVNTWLRDVNGQKQPIEAQLDELLERPWAKPLKVGLLGGTAVASLTTFGVSANPLVGGLLGSYVGYRLYRALKDGGTFKTRALTGAMLGDMAHAKLGAFFNVYSAVVNMSQTALNTYPVLKGYTMTGMKLLFEAAGSRFSGKPNRYWRLLERADIATKYRYGDQPTHQFTRESRLAAASLFLFNHAEMFNRAVSFLGGYQRAIDGGASESAALDAATRAMRRTQFHYGNANKPEILRSVLLRVPLQFKNFMLQEISFIAGLDKKTELPLFLLSLFLLAGTLGLPGADLLDAILGMWANFSPLDEIKKQALEMQAQGDLEGAAGAVMVRGLPSLVGDDLSLRVGVGEKFLPTAARDFWGPWVSTANGAMRLGGLNATLADQLRNLTPGLGKPAKSLEAAANGLPLETAFSEPRKFFEALADDKIVYTNPWQGGAMEFDERIIDKGDLVRMGLGGSPLRVSQIRDIQGIRAHETERLDRKRKRYLNQVVNAYRLYGADDDGREKLVTVLGRVSTRAKDDGVTITREQVDRALKRAMEPRILRMVKQTRRELRPEIWGLVESAAPDLAKPRNGGTK